MRCTEFVWGYIIYTDHQFRQLVDERYQRRHPPLIWESFIWPNTAHHTQNPLLQRYHRCVVERAYYVVIAIICSDSNIMWCSIRDERKVPNGQIYQYRMHIRVSIVSKDIISRGREWVLIQVWLGQYRARSSALASYHLNRTSSHVRTLDTAHKQANILRNSGAEWPTTRWLDQSTGQVSGLANYKEFVPYVRYSG